MLLLAASSPPPLMSDRDVGKKHVNSTYVNVNKQTKKATYAAVRPTTRLAGTAGGLAHIACRHFPTRPLCWGTGAGELQQSHGLHSSGV